INKINNDDKNLVCYMQTTIIPEKHTNGSAIMLNIICNFPLEKDCFLCCSHFYYQHCCLLLLASCI
ncbi:unnamed protein product, partial [Diamesa hyperborea]